MRTAGSRARLTTITHGPRKLRRSYAAATDEFAAWFKGQVLALSGVDPTLAPLGPPTSEVYSWSGSPEMANTFAAHQR